MNPGAKGSVCTQSALEVQVLGDATLTRLTNHLLGVSVPAQSCP